MEFYRDEPTPLTAWRLAVLLGANSRTYKFALAEALLHFARAGREDVPLEVLARRYSLQLVQHAATAPQAPPSSQGAKDFLRVAAEDGAQVLDAGAPTERLVAAAQRTMPGMVMDKFHNVSGGVLPIRFYSLTGRAPHQTVVLEPVLRRIAGSEHSRSLDDELSARWSIVETSFATGVGASLQQDGLLTDLATMRLTDVRRRRGVTGVREATIGFQYGPCLICGTTIGPDEAVAVDHVFPFALMRRAGWTWRGPDLDAVWNLAPAHDPCNATKSDAWPTAQTQHRLAQRNAAILQSPHPLRRTLANTLLRGGVEGGDAGAWHTLFGRILSA